METIDMILAAFLVFGLVKGFRNGFFMELASLVSVMLGIYLAIRFSYVAKSILEREVSWDPKIIQVSAFAITFLVVIILVASLAKVFTSLARWTSLGFLNHFFGAFLGLLRTTLVLSVLLNLLQKADFEKALFSEKSIEASTVYPFVKEVSKEIYPSIAEWFKAFQEDDFRLENESHAT